MYLLDSELLALGFKSLGKNVLVSEKASIYGALRISIGDNCRIDDFCILSAGAGGIEIHDYVHVACYALIIGQGKVTLKDFAGISSRVSIYSSSDNYDGEWMTNPCLPKEVTNAKHEDVVLGRHVIVGASSVVLPGVELGDGCSVGAMSLVNKSYPPLTIIKGIPAVKSRDRKSNIFTLEKQVK